MLLSVEAAQPRPLDVHLASMEGDLAVGLPPAVRLPLPAPRMAGTTDRLRIVIHHLAKSLQAGSQAERLKARKNVRQRLKLQRSRRNRSRCSNLVHGVAFLCGISTPSLSAQGQQRRSFKFNIRRDDSLLRSRDGLINDRTIVSLPQREVDPANSSRSASERGLPERNTEPKRLVL